MCFSPNSNLVQRTIEINYEKRKRATSVKWFFINAAVFLLFSYDLTCTGSCPTSLARLVELVVAGAACVSALQHGARLVSSRSHRAPLAPLTRRQLCLLGLTETDLELKLAHNIDFHGLHRLLCELRVNQWSTSTDSSLVLLEPSTTGGSGAARECVPSDAPLSLSLSPRRWREPRSPPEPPSPRGGAPTPPSPPRSSASPPHDSLSRDRFIADQHSLSDYLKQYEAQHLAEPGSPLEAAGCARTAPPPTYQLSAVDTEGGKHEEGSPQGCPQIYWQLDVEPHKLTQWNLNLRLWIHITVLERLVEAMDATDAALARLVGGEARLGRLGGERLRALAPALPALHELLPYLEPFADQRYVVRRIRELARAPCLSSYRWNAGGADWDDTQPTDAELILHLLATYLDGQMLQSGNPRPFSSQYLGGGGELSLQRVAARPPQWAVSVEGALAGAARGRNNLLHALLLLLAVAARRDPPALARTHLGPSGLNMLWILS